MAHLGYLACQLHAWRGDIWGHFGVQRGTMIAGVCVDELCCLQDFRYKRKLTPNISQHIPTYPKYVTCRPSLTVLGSPRTHIQTSKKPSKPPSQRLHQLGPKPPVEIRQPSSTHQRTQRKPRPLPQTLLSPPKPPPFLLHKHPQALLPLALSPRSLTPK